MVKIAMIIGLATALIVGVAACSFDQPLLRKLHYGRVTTFADVYPILQANCSGCHEEGGSAAASWTLNREPTATRYAQCQLLDDINRRHRCTTSLQLTEGEFPLITRGSLGKSMPFINACDPKNSFHIGSSIPERLQDEECKTISDWIMQGCPDEKPESDD